MKIGQRVKVKSLGIKGQITYIDWPYLRFPFMNSVQIQLDEPYYKSGSKSPNEKMYRTGYDDLVLLKPKELIHKPDVAEFLKWLDKAY